MIVMDGEDENRLKVEKKIGEFFQVWRGVLRKSPKINTSNYLFVL